MIEYDVAIVGGGPAGATVGTIVKKYMPSAKVVILERETFPRDHVGESQLPPITAVLEEMGCWDKVEEAGFPIKTGAIYRWGSTDDLWRFDFLIGEKFEDKPRPNRLEGQRRQTTFHVERSLFDKILLDHAAELGCEVRQGWAVTDVECDGDRILSLTCCQSKSASTPGSLSPEPGSRVVAKHYIDASGHTGILRRSLGIPISEPTSLKNIAIWRYWDNPEWATQEGVGKGGIRIRIFSLGNGWIWFIPLTRSRSSVGFVTHAEHYKASGLTPAQLFEDACRRDSHTAELLRGAQPEGDIKTTKDWSFLAERTAGQNWMLVGESAGFADPILAGGMSLAMVGGREAAYILADLLRTDEGDIPAPAGEGVAETNTHEAWLKQWYGDLQTKRISQHIKFADYWYSANGHFSELKEYTSQIAAEAGLDLNPEEAFRWLAAGGFVSDDLTFPVVATYRLGAVKAAMQFLTGESAEWQINLFNHFTLNLSDGEIVYAPHCRDGRIERIKCYCRGQALLPMIGMYRLVFRALGRANDAAALMRELRSLIASNPEFVDAHNALLGALEALEGMVAEGWVTGEIREGRPHMEVTLDESSVAVGE